MRLSAETRSDILTLLDEGVDRQEIANDLGITVKTVESVERARQRELARKEEREMAHSAHTIAGDKFNGLLRTVAPNTFEGTCRRADGTFERKRFEGLRSAAQEGWEAWCEEIREREQWVEQLERREPKPVDKAPAPAEPEPPEETPAPVAGGAVYVLVVDGRNVGLFRDADRALAIGERLGGALGLECDVSEIEFWEGE